MKINISNSCYLACVFWACLLACANTLAHNKTPELVFVVIYVQEQPIISMDKESGQYLGMVPDVAQRIASELGLKLRFQVGSRNTIENQIMQGKGDATLLSPEWAADPKQLLFTIPLFEHKEYLYSLEPFSGDQVADWLLDKSICLRKDYIYPQLQPYFDQKRLTRLDVSSQAPPLTLLAKGRCDLAYVTNYRAEWMTKNLNEAVTLYRSPEVMKFTDVSFAFAQKWRKQMPQINNIIRDMQVSGEMEKIIQRNIYEQSQIR